MDFLSVIFANSLLSKIKSGEHHIATRNYNVNEQAQYELDGKILNKENEQDIIVIKAINYLIENELILPNTIYNVKNLHKPD